MLSSLFLILVIFVQDARYCTYEKSVHQSINDCKPLIHDWDQLLHFELRYLLREIWFPLRILQVFAYFLVFSIWKSLRVLQKAHIKIVAHAIYTYFLLSYTLLFCWKIKRCCGRCFPQQSRPLFNDIYCETILVWGLVSVWLTSATHCLYYTPC